MKKLRYSYYLLYTQDNQKYESSKQSYKDLWAGLKFFSSIIIHSEMLYWIGYLGFALTGLFYNEFFFSLLLIEFIARFKTMKTIVLSVWGKIKEILLTLVLV